MKKNILISISTIIITLLLCEIIIRIFFPQISEHDKMFTKDEQLGWKFIPNKKGIIIYPDEAYHYITTNEEGFRDDTFSTIEEESKKIMVLGDSFVSNVSVDDEEVFTEVMETNLLNYEVLNFGVNGYGQVQEYMVQREWLPQIKPDLLMMMIYIRNDFTDNTGEVDWLYSRPYAALKNDNILQMNPPSQPIKNEIRSNGNFLGKFHLYQFVKTRLQRIRGNIKSKSNSQIPNKSVPPEIYLCNTSPSKNTKMMFLVMEELLLKVSDFAKSQNVPLVFAIAPSIIQVEDTLWETIVIKNADNSENYSKSFPNERLLNFAKNNNLNMIDLLPNLQLEAQRGKKMYNFKEQHWTAKGNKIVAHTLLEYLTLNGFIE